VPPASAGAGPTLAPGRQLDQQNALIDDIAVTTDASCPAM
jgi:hypothetical protein